MHCAGSIYTDLLSGVEDDGAGDDLLVGDEALLDGLTPLGVLAGQLLRGERLQKVALDSLGHSLARSVRKIAKVFQLTHISYVSELL